MSSRETESNSNANGQENSMCEPAVGESEEPIGGSGLESFSHNQPAIAGTSEPMEIGSSTEGVDDDTRFPRRKLSLRRRQYRRRSGADESSDDEHVPVSYLDTPFF